MTKNKKMKKGMSSKQIFSIVTAVITLLANIAVAALIFMSMQYSGLDTGLFFSVFGAIVCVLIIADIIFFVGFNHRDQILKIITCVLTVILFIGGSIGSVVMIKNKFNSVGLINLDKRKDNNENISYNNVGEVNNGDKNR